MEEQQQEEARPPQSIQQRGESSPAVSYQPMTTTEKAKYAAIAGVPSLLILELLNAKGPGFAIAGLVGYGAWHFSDRIRDARSERRADHQQKTPQPFSKRVQSAIYWLGTGHAMPEASERDGRSEDVEGTIETTMNDTTTPSTEEDALFTLDLADDTNGVARLTIEQIVRKCEPNSYKIFIGRSMTKPGNKAIRINFYKQHFRFIGASQRGKSSMVAAFLDIVTQTHDSEHVRLVLLDKEDQTSNLFAHLPHVLLMKKADGRTVKLHARNEDQVLQYLEHCVAIMKHRYTMNKAKVLALPIILIYVEEFLALKNEFRARIDTATNKEAKEKATSDYASFVYCVNLIAQQGLKVRLQLLLCAQVEYADDDFREAMASVSCGFSFCVPPKAAASAGFRNNELLQLNAKANKVGQAVVETPDCNDLVLAPDYELERLILAFELAHPDIHPEAEDDISEHETAPVESLAGKQGNRGEPLERLGNNAGNRGERPDEGNEIPPAFTQAQEVQVLLAFEELKLTGKSLTRTALKDYLGWTSRQYTSILKPICDKHGILMD